MAYPTQEFLELDAHDFVTPNIEDDFYPTDANGLCCQQTDCRIDDHHSVDLCVLIKPTMPLDRAVLALRTLLECLEKGHFAEVLPKTPADTSKPAKAGK